MTSCCFRPMSVSWYSPLYHWIFRLSSDVEYEFSHFGGRENESLGEWHPRCLGEQMTLEVSIRAFLSMTLGLTSSQTLKGEKHRPNNVLWDFRVWTVRLSLRVLHSRANRELYNTFYGIHERLIWTFLCLFFQICFEAKQPFLEVIAS